MVPLIGRAPLAEFSRTAACNYVTALIEEGRSPNTIRKCKVVLGALVAMAAEGCGSQGRGGQSGTMSGSPPTMRLSSTDR